jgi:hypothetical protein
MARMYAFNSPKVCFHIYIYIYLLIILLQVWSVARKYAFNPPKVRFHLNINLPTHTTHKSKITVEGHESPRMS